MKGSRVARRYARALLEVAERGQAENWGLELDRLAATVDSPELTARLTSPEISETARREAMAKIAETLNLSFPLRSFAVVIARHGRIDEIGAIAQAYRDQLDEMLSRARATLTFAVAPGDAEVARVVAGLEGIAGKKIIPTVKVDKDLLGGVVAELGGKIYDGSLATRLALAQQRLAGQV
ncbi:MAG: ATP synthase F1 subunit delta [Candidatus Binataceae bacterium]